MADVGKVTDRFLDELEFLYQQRRDARALVAELEIGAEDRILLLTLLADRVKAGDKEGASV